MKSQLFVFGVELLSAMEPEEVEATYKDMIELKINKPPFSEFTIQLPYGKTFRRILLADSDLVVDEDLDVPFRLVYKISNLNDTQANINCTFMAAYKDRPWKFYNYIDGLMARKDLDIQARDILTKTCYHVSAYYLSYLIVLLATRNVERVMSHNRLAKFGRGKQDYEYVTTLKIGKITEYEDRPANMTGLTVRPHLRRGHVRRQHYGPNMTYIKKIFVQPVFVNGYRPEDDKRKAYNVSMERKQ